MTIACKTATVTFRDGSSLTLSESNWNIGMKLNRMMQAASLRPALDDLDAQTFRVTVYPKLVACVVKGVPPTEDEAREIPEAELDKWYEAVQKLNPKWFVLPEDLAAEEEPAPEIKKKESAGIP